MGGGFEGGGFVDVGGGEVESDDPPPPPQATNSVAIAIPMIEFLYTRFPFEMSCAVQLPLHRTSRTSAPRSSQSCDVTH